MHPTPLPLYVAPDRPVQLHLRARAPLFVFARGFAAAPAAFAARVPGYLHKKNCPVSMICITILRCSSFLFCKTASPKMQEPSPREAAGYINGVRFPRRRPTSEGELDRRIRCHTRCLDPQVSPLR